MRRRVLLFCCRYVFADLPSYIDARLVVEISKFRRQSTTFGRVLKVEAVDEVDDRFEAPKIPCGADIDLPVYDNGTAFDRSLEEKRGVPNYV